MEVRYLPNHEAYQQLTTAGLRKAFVLESLFHSGSVSMVYCDADRVIVGGAIPVGSPLRLLATSKEMAAEYFTERRELGIVNLGATGSVRTDGTTHTLDYQDMLYVGRGVREIAFASAQPANPALFYFVSYPAHTGYPVTRIPRAEAARNPLGTADDANKRTIRKYIHTSGAKSCQLVMGLTELEPGSVWNTMPPHTHHRRSEVYLYVPDEDALVVHLMGKPDETRSLIMRRHQAVISPGWSVHCGSGTRHYQFVWAMGGENQEFADMDAVPMSGLL